MGRKPLGEKRLSNAEKQKLYREKQNSVQRKLKDKLRKQAARQKVYDNPETHQKFLENKNKVQREYRKRKTEDNAKNDVAPVKFDFPHLSRSLKKVKRSLPRNESQKKVVINTLFKENIACSPRKMRLISTWTNVQNKVRSGRPSIIDEGLRIKLDEFLCGNSISFTLPGRNNQIYVGKNEKGESEFKSKKYILWTLNELSKIISEDKDEEFSKLKFSTIYRYIRSNKEYIIQSKIPEVNCLCPVCEGIELICDGVNKSCDEINLPTKCHELILKVACNPVTEKCAKDVCENCPVIDLESLNDVEKVSFYHWVKEAHYKKQLTELPGSDATEKLLKLFKTLKLHYFNKREQSKMYKKNIEELKEDEIVIHVDYSENYKNKHQNEIKSAFYGQGQFSIYTACIYALSEKIVCHSFALVTPENDHSCNVSFALNHFLISEMEKMKTVKKINFWSDGCASQFRSQYAFYMLTKFNRDINIQWHFFEANHGKGAVDGIGGKVKHSVFRKVLSKQVVIESPKHFAEYANKILTNINVIFVDNQELNLGYHEECRENSVYIPGTLKVHFVDRIIEGKKCVLHFYDSSTADKPIKSQAYEIDNSAPTVGKYHIVAYEGSLFPGKVEAINGDGSIKVNCLQKVSVKKGSTWKWPDVVDIHDYPVQDVKQEISVPRLLPGGSRNIVFEVPELSHIWGK